MREDVKWTNLSRRQISRRLKDLGTPAGKNVVSRLLWEHGYRRRKPQKKRTMGQHADRNAQFEKIAELKKQYLSGGHPVISIDTKKKEMLGDFHRDGVTDAVEPTIVNDHDFASASDGKVIPHGIYDVAKNEASVPQQQLRHLGTGVRQHRALVSRAGTQRLSGRDRPARPVRWWRKQQLVSLHLQRRPASIIESAGAEDSDLSLSSLLLQVQSDRASRLPARDPSLPGRPARNHRDRQALHRKNRNDQGAQGRCPHARQGVSDRTNMTIKFDEYLPKWNYTAIPDGR